MHKIPPLHRGYIWGVLVVALLLGSCSGGPSAPDLSPTGPQTLQNAPREQNNYLWGEYVITMKNIEDEAGNITGVDVDIAPMRTSQKHWDVTSFVVPANVKIQVSDFIAGDPYSEITATVTLTNPTALTGYDVRGIIYPPTDMCKLKDLQGHTFHDGLTTLFPPFGAPPVNPYMAFNTEIPFRPFAGGAQHAASYKFRKHNAYKLASMPYKISASFPSNALEPVGAYIFPPTPNDHIYPQGSNAVILAEVTDWQNNVDSVTLTFPSEFGLSGPQPMAKISENPANYTSKWQYVLSAGGGNPSGLRTVRLTATSPDETLEYMKDFEVEVTYDDDPPSWKVAGQEGIYDNISGPQFLYLFFHEAWDLSLPLQYVFWGNSQTSPFDGSVLKSVLSSDYVGYTPFGGNPNTLFFYGIRLIDKQGIPDDNMLEYSCTRYTVEPRWNFIKDQPPTEHGVFASPAIGDVDGDGVKDIVVGAMNGRVYAYGGSGTDSENTIIWEYDTGSFVWSSPALADLNNDDALDVIFASDDTNVYALNGKTGLPLWTPFDTGDGYQMHGSPAISQMNGVGAPDIVVGTDGITGGTSGRMICIDGDTGLEIWSYIAGGGIRGTPGLADITGDGVPDVCFGALDNKIYLVNGDTGGLLWTYAVAPGLNNIDCSPVMVDVDGDDTPDAIVGGLSHPGDGTGFMVALNGASSGPFADEIWTQEDIWGNARRAAAPVKLNDDEVYDFIVTSYATETYSIYALDGASGEIMYKKLASGVPSADTFNYSAPIVGDFTGDGHLNALYGRQDGFVDFVNIADFGLPGDFAGKNLFSLQASTSQEPEISATPAIDDVDGDGELELVVCNTRGYTYVIDLHAPVPTDPALRGWMQHQGNRWHTGTPEFTPPDE